MNSYCAIFVFEASLFQTMKSTSRSASARGQAVCSEIVRNGKTMSELKGKVCLVTGGAGHIGRAICEALLSHGAEVIAVGRREPAMPIAHTKSRQLP